MGRLGFGTSRAQLAGWLVLALSVSALLGSCTEESHDTTRVLVSVMRDPALSLTRVTYRVFAPEAEASRDVPLGSFSAEGAALDQSFEVRKREQPAFLLSVQGYGADDPRTPLVEHRVRAAFVAGKTLALHVFLSRLCASKSCDLPAGQTCHGEPRDGVPSGSCGPIAGPYPLDEVTRFGAEDDWVPNAAGDAGAGALDARVLDAGALDASTQTDGSPGFDASRPGQGLDATPGPSACLGIPDAATCNPVARCGCAAGLHCQARDDQLVCAPIPAIGIADGSPCKMSAECAEGLTCRIGICRPYCFSDADCDGQTCDLDAKGIGVCYRACGGTADPACPSGVDCNPVDLADLEGRFCTVPWSVCPHLEDGECDEPGLGTGVCAAGSDVSDCCAAARGDVCDPFAQCGCKSDQLCTVDAFKGETATFACARAGDASQGDPCEAVTDCQRGLSCFGGLCSKFCRADGECGNGECIAPATEQGVAIQNVKACVYACDFATGAPCRPGSACMRLSDGDFCFRQPTTCATPANGVCDELTRKCPPGTDPDCPR